MNTLFEQAFDILHGAWRFRWWALVAAAVAAVLGWTYVFMLPDRYEAHARVFVDTRTALKPVLQGLTVEQDVNAQLNSFDSHCWPVRSCRRSPSRPACCRRA